MPAVPTPADVPFPPDDGRPAAEGPTRPGLRRGRLKVYLGAAAGVGKTQRMLEEAHALRAGGVDVVLAFVEPHGRAEVAALAAGLELVPRRTVEFRGVVAEDMDLEAVLARRPQIAIVDELAHTNPPGSRHARRYQDVLTLLDAGISVIGTVNVQHLESLNDLLERLADLTVHETIPDSFVKNADHAVDIDISVDDLLERLHAGKIYPRERIPWALAHVFRRECLVSLRELALREVAETLDRRDLVSAPRPAQVSGRVMVCLSSLSPRALTLLRRASRFAGRLATDWFVVYVETPREAPERIAPEVQKTLVANVEKARELGAEVVRLKARDPVAALVDFARSHGVATILAGRSHRPWWKRLLRRSPVDRLFDEAVDFDLYVVAQEDEGGHA
jgi:two-component system, OmpR family, sensor histidine kinase KdpD